MLGRFLSLLYALSAAAAQFINVVPGRLALRPDDVREDAGRDSFRERLYRLDLGGTERSLAPPGIGDDPQLLDRVLVRERVAAVGEDEVVLARDQFYDAGPRLLGGRYWIASRAPRQSVTTASPRSGLSASSSSLSTF